MAVKGNLQTNQRRAIAALLECTTVGDAAKAAGIGERTLNRWLAEDEAFLAELRKAEGIFLDKAVRGLLALQAKAIGVLAAVFDDPDASNGTRLRAATVVLDQLVKLRDLRNVEERIVALEKAIAQHE